LTTTSLKFQLAMDRDYVDLVLNVEVPCYYHQNCLAEDMAIHYACPATKIYANQACSLHFNPHCWGPSASEGPQKQDLTVFLEYNV
jgi:hypothetical protein